MRKTSSPTSSEAAGTAAISIVVHLIYALIDRGVVDPKEMQKILFQAYEDQSDTSGAPRSEVNDKAQRLIAELMAALQAD